MCYGIIYRASFDKNGKSYIGQTTCSLEKRIREHKCESKNEKDKRYFYKAIRKHGFDNITWEILEESKGQEELNLKEVYWIGFYKTLDNKKGYNLKEGGSHGKHSEETKKKLSQMHFGENNPMYMKKGWSKGLTKETDERVRKISETRRTRIENGEISPGAVWEGQEPWNKGMKGQYTTQPCSEENKAKISKKNRGANNGNAKLNEEKVLQIKKMLREGKTQKEIAEIFGTSKPNISNINTGKIWKQVILKEGNNE